MKFTNWAYAILLFPSRVKFHFFLLDPQRTRLFNSCHVVMKLVTGPTIIQLVIDLVVIIVLSFWLKLLVILESMVLVGKHALGISSSHFSRPILERGWGWENLGRGSNLDAFVNKSFIHNIPAFGLTLLFVHS